ncbi:MAG: NADH-quinone oxidoreductase subunit A [Bacteroidia bacterium]|nr:NADH-quinone oxidoreductase subunit A [Bacteroidia bacterium]
MEVAVFFFYTGLAVLVGLGGLIVRSLIGKRRSPSAQPYECGEKPLHEPYVGFLWPYLRLVILLLVLEAEVLLALPWVWVHRQIAGAVFWIELTALVLPLAVLYGYALRQGWLVPRSPKKAWTLSPPYQHLNAYLTSLGPKPSSYSSHPASEETPPSPDALTVPQTPSADAPQTPDGQYSAP